MEVKRVEHTFTVNYSEEGSSILSLDRRYKKGENMLVYDILDPKKIVKAKISIPSSQSILSIEQENTTVSYPVHRYSPLVLFQEEDIGNIFYTKKKDMIKIFYLTEKGNFGIFFRFTVIRFSKAKKCKIIVHNITINKMGIKLNNKVKAAIFDIFKKEVVVNHTSKLEVKNYEAIIKANNPSDIKFFIDVLKFEEVSRFRNLNTNNTLTILRHEN